MRIKQIASTFVLVTALFFVSHAQLFARDSSSSEGEILNVPDFVDQPVTMVDNILQNNRNSITTIFANDNGLSGTNPGIFFDIENITDGDISVTGWDINCIEEESPSSSISVYSRAGTYEGFVDTMDGWNLEGTAQVTCAGDDLPTPLGVGGIVLEPGTTGIAMVIHGTDTSEWNYTDGNGANQIYNNDQLEIRTGVSKNMAFEVAGSTFSPRVWNGTVYYTFERLPIPTLSEWGLIAMAGVLGLAAFIVIRKKYSVA